MRNRYNLALLVLAVAPLLGVPAASSLANMLAGRLSLPSKLGMRFHNSHDSGVSLVLFLESSDRARSFAAALRGEGMHAGSVFDKGIPDRHIYYHWDYVLKKRTPDRHGLPWSDPVRPCSVEYSPDMCPRSLEWLNRSVMIPLTQKMSDAHVDSCIRAIHKVHAAV
jgi:hypothetical protein